MAQQQNIGNHTDLENTKIKMSQLESSSEESLPGTESESVEQNRNQYSSEEHNRDNEDYINPRFRLGKIGFLTVSLNWLVGAVVLILFLFGLIVLTLSFDHGSSSPDPGGIQKQKAELEDYKNQSQQFNNQMTRLKKYFKGRNWDTELLIAIDGNDEEGLKEIIAFGAKLNLGTFGGSQLLNKAAACNDPKVGLRMIKYLIENGAGVTASFKTRDGFTFLHKLVDDRTTLTPSQFHDIASYLVAKDLTSVFNIQGGFYRGMRTMRYSFQYRSSTPLQMAVKNLDVEAETLNLLYQNGVDFNSTNSNSESLLKYAIEGKRSTKLLSDLIDLGADWKQVNNLKDNLLHIAALYSNLEGMKFLVKLGLDVNSVNVHGNTPLHYVALYGKEGSLDIVKFLIESGGDITLTNENYPAETALDRALVRYDQKDKNEIVQLLKNSR